MCSVSGCRGMSFINKQTNTSQFYCQHQGFQSFGHQSHIYDHETFEVKQHEIQSKTDQQSDPPPDCHVLTRIELLVEMQRENPSELRVVLEFP